MGKGLPDEMSIAERERLLWSAAEGYMRGDLDRTEFEEMERIYSGDFGRAAIGLAKEANRRRTFVSSMILAGCLAALVASVVFFVTKSSWALIGVSAILAVIAGPVFAALPDWKWKHKG